MPTDFLQDIRDFHKKFGLEYNGPPRALSGELAAFRRRFMEEELREWVDHIFASNLELTLTDVPDPEVYRHHLEQTLDALVDLMYVLLGTAHLQGFDDIFEEAWRRVHAANMNKVRATSAADSKRGSTLDVVKPEGWEPPTHTDLLGGHLLADREA